MENNIIIHNILKFHTTNNIENLRLIKPILENLASKYHISLAKIIKTNKNFLDLAIDFSSTKGYNDKNGILYHKVVSSINEFDNKN